MNAYSRKRERRTPENIIYIKVPYINDYFHGKLKNILFSLKLQNVVRFYCTSNNLSKIFSIKKHKLICQPSCEICNISDFKNACFLKNVIYIITCNVCNLKYVGQTGRFVKNRLKEHMTRIDSAVHKHQQDYHNELNIKDVYRFNILHQGLRSTWQRLHVESMYIQKYRQSLMNGCISTLTHASL